MAWLKRLRVPAFWRIPKKMSKWVVHPSPGPHKKFECIPLLILIRDILKLAETGKEAKKIIKSGAILVDGRVRKDHRYPVGLMDVVEIPKLKKYYRIVPGKKGYLKIIEIDEKEGKMKLLKIVNKTLVKGGRIQLNFHDGKNILIDEDVFKTGDSVLVSLPDLKILQHIKMKEGCLVLITKGKNAGKLGKLKEIKIVRGIEPNKTICEIEGKDEVVLLRNVFVVGEKEPVITVV